MGKSRFMKKKIKISERQWNRLRIMYAFDLATSHHIINPDIVFIEGLNPHWIRQKDALAMFGRSGKNFVEGLEKMKIGEIRQKGCFKIRRTKKGVIVYTELVRLRS